MNGVRPKQVVPRDDLISQNVFIKWFVKVYSSEKSSNYRLLLLIETIS